MSRIASRSNSPLFELDKEAPPWPSFVGAIVLAALAALAFAAAPMPWPFAGTVFAALAFAAAP